MCATNDWAWCIALCQDKHVCKIMWYHVVMHDARCMDLLHVSMDMECFSPGFFNRIVAFSLRHNKYWLCEHWPLEVQLEKYARPSYHWPKVCTQEIQIRLPVLFFFFMIMIIIIIKSNRRTTASNSFPTATVHLSTLYDCQISSIVTIRKSIQRNTNFDIYYKGNLIESKRFFRFFLRRRHEKTDYSRAQYVELITVVFTVHTLPFWNLLVDSE